MYSVVRFADSVNNHVSGPSVANFDLLATQARENLMPETYMITYKEKTKKIKYQGIKMVEVELKQSSTVTARMPAQPHFNTVNRALSIVDSLDKKVIVVAVGGKYSPQADQFSSLLKSNYGKDCRMVVEGHGSDVCGYQLIEFENLYKNIYRRADLVLLMETPFAKLVFEKEEFPTDNMAVCPTVVRWEDHVEKMKKNPEIMGEIKSKYYKKYKMPSDAEYILTVGRFQREKGHKYLVKAAKKILEEYPNLYFLLGGSEKGTIDEIKKMIGNEKRIKLLGKIPFQDIYALMANSKAFVIPSIELWKNNRIFFAETGPRTVVEAMAAGIVGKNVVIASSSGGTPWKFNMEEWLIKASKVGAETPKKPIYENIDKGVYNAKNRGLLIKQRSPEAIAEAIRIVTEDEKFAKRLNQEGGKYVEKWYGSIMITKIYNRILDSIC